MRRLTLFGRKTDKKEQAAATTSPDVSLKAVSEAPPESKEQTHKTAVTDAPSNGNPTSTAEARREAAPPAPQPQPSDQPSTGTSKVSEQSTLNVSLQDTKTADGPAPAAPSVVSQPIPAPSDMPTTPRRLTLFRRKTARKEQAADSDATAKTAFQFQPDTGEPTAKPVGSEAPSAVPGIGPAPVAPLVVSQAVPAALEQRIHQLEALVARLQDTKALEERVSDHVTKRLKKSKVTSDAPDFGAAARQMLPVATQVFAPPTGVAQGGLPQADPVPQRRWGLWLVWLLWDIYTELRSMLAMYFDRSYPMSWGIRLVPLIVPLLMVASWFFLTNVPLIGGVLVTVIDLVVAYLGYKILSNEAQRYRQTDR